MTLQISGQVGQHSTAPTHPMWEVIEHEGIQLSSYSKTLISVIRDHYSTFSTIVPKISSINQSEVDASLTSSIETFVAHLKEDSVRLTALFSKIHPSIQPVQSKREKEKLCFEIYCEMIKYSKVFFNNFTKEINPYLEAVAKERLSCNFKNSEACEIFESQIKSIIDSIELTQYSYDIIKAAIESRIELCSTAPKTLKDQYHQDHQEPQDDLSQTLQSKCEEPDFTPALSILMRSLPELGVSMVKEGYIDPHGGFPELPTFSKMSPFISFSKPPLSDESLFEERDPPKLLNHFSHCSDSSFSTFVKLADPPPEVKLKHIGNFPNQPNRKRREPGSTSSEATTGGGVKKQPNLSNS